MICVQNTENFLYISNENNIGDISRVFVLRPPKSQFQSKNYYYIYRFHCRCMKYNECNLHSVVIGFILFVFSSLLYFIWMFILIYAVSVAIDPLIIIVIVFIRIKWLRHCWLRTPNQYHARFYIIVLIWLYNKITVFLCDCEHKHTIPIPIHASNIYFCHECRPQNVNINGAR